jgi:hypothetical protein
VSDSITMRDTNSSYLLNSAPYGSIYVCEGCNFVGTGNIY